METKCIKNYHFGCFLHRVTKKSFRLENFHSTNERLFTCYDHLFEVMYYYLISCLHYNRKTFFRLVVDTDPIPRIKCYLCYRKTIRKLLKYFSLFIVWKWGLTFWDLVTTQSVQQRDLQMQQVLITTQQKKLLSRPLALRKFQLT